MIDIWSIKLQRRDRQLEAQPRNNQDKRQGNERRKRIADRAMAMP